MIGKKVQANRLTGMASISGLGSHFCPLDDERRYALDDGVSAIAGGTDETRIFKA